MDYRLLEYFLRISELGSINRAATDLHLSQSALSRHIASLEHDLGASLFNRHHGGVTLTEAGSLLADRARPILRQLTILKEQIGDKAAGQLAVGVPASWHHIFTADYVSRIINECPGVKLRVFEGASNALSEQMSAGLLDLAIVPFKSESSLGYNQTKLLREPAVLVGPAAARLDANNALSVTQLDGLKLVLVNRPNTLRLQVEHAMSRARANFKLVAEADTLQLSLTMARRSGIYTVIPNSALFDFDVRKGLSWSPLKGVYLTWSLYVNESRAHSHAVREGKRLAVELVSGRFATPGQTSMEVQMFV